MPLFQNAVLNKYLFGVDEKKVELSLDKEAEWMEYFNQQKAQANDLKSQIAQTDKEINGMVFELYGLKGGGDWGCGGGNSEPNKQVFRIILLYKYDYYKFY